MPEQLTGVVEKVTFHNADTGFAVLKAVVPGRRGLVTVVGKVPGVTAGEHFQADGQWKQDPSFGLQFDAASLRTFPPASAEGIERYLGSGLVKGIGPKLAERIVGHFRERTLQVIDESPAFLTEVPGIGPKLIARIRQSWQDQKAVRGIMVFLQDHGLGVARAVRIYKTYGDSAVEKVRENPYRLATDIWGVGFPTADALATRLGVQPGSPLRARAAVRYALQKLNGDGHVGCPEALVLEKTHELTKNEIDPDVVGAVVEQGRAEGEFVRDTPAKAEDLSPQPPPRSGEGEPDSSPLRFGEGSSAPWLFLKPMFMAELGVARAIRQLRQGTHPLPAFDAEGELAGIEARLGVGLADAQRRAVLAATRAKVLVITGGPGVGKTTIVRALLELFARRDLRIALCAPTGRAAKRLAETTGREARTIHRLLEFDPAYGGFKRDRDNPLEYDLIVVDEASMVDVVLANSLLRAVPPWACLVVVGDVDQLPSVGPGSVLGDLIRSDTVEVVRLTQIFRQAGESWIVRAAHAINSGELPESAPAGGGGDFYFIEAPTPDAIRSRIVTMITERIPERFGLDPVKDVQVLTPRRDTELGVTQLNLLLQEVLNPKRLDRPDRDQEVKRFENTYRVGDKVLQTRNDYHKEVFNGDIGRVTRLDPVNEELTIDYEGRPVVYEYGELDEVMPAYATTIHRSQGSEYPAVIIPVHTQHYTMLQRNLLYTAVTRGKRLVVVVGTRKALRMAVERQDMARRHSLLCERLRAGGEDEADVDYDGPD